MNNYPYCSFGFLIIAILYDKYTAKTLALFLIVEAPVVVLVRQVSSVYAT